MKKRILEIMTVTVLTMSVLSGCKGFATTETEYDTESKRDLYDPAITGRQADPPVLYRSGESMEHTGTDICQGIKDGRQDYRRTEAQ